MTKKMKFVIVNVGTDKPAFWRTDDKLYVNTSWEVGKTFVTTKSDKLVGMIARILINGWSWKE